MKCLTGYHGTTVELAKNIIETKHFNISKGSRQWLGEGIYFYTNYNDAVAWHGTDGKSKVTSILHAVIYVEDNEFFDFDTDYAKEQIKILKKYLADSYADIIDGLSTMQLQCFLCNYILMCHPEIKVMAASFPTEKSTMKTLVDERSLKREFSVRKSEYISCINEIDLLETEDRVMV